MKSFRIFDRAGSLMFEKTRFQPNDPKFGWDGRFNGERLNAGVYVWQLELEGYLATGAIFNEVQAGSVTIIY